MFCVLCFFCGVVSAIAWLSLSNLVSIQQKLIIAMHIYYESHLHHAIYTFFNIMNNVWLCIFLNSYEQTFSNEMKWNEHGRMRELSFRLWMTSSFSTTFMLVNSSTILIRLMAIIILHHNQVGKISRRKTTKRNDKPNASVSLSLSLSFMQTHSANK